MKAQILTIALSLFAFNAFAQTPPPAVPPSAPGPMHEEKAKVEAACASELSQSKCEVGHHIRKCIETYKKTNKEFHASDTCKNAIKEFHAEKKAKKSH
jgi:hypothetical protein